MKQLSLELLLETEEAGPSSSWVGAQLVGLGGGRLIQWQPEMGRYPARAVFQFSSEEDRVRFAAAAARFPGVTARSS
jgi:hypothetical protein